MKTFQVIILAIFGIGALIGLVVFATTKGVGGGQAVGPVSVWGLLPQESVDTALGELVTGDKRLGEVSYRQVQTDTFSSELAQAIAEGRGPDLIIMTQEELISERGKLTVIPFETMPERTFVNTFVPMAELLLTPSGVYGLPVAVDPLVLFYNRQALTDAGVAAAPSTWEAVNGLAQTMTRATAAGAVERSVIPLGDYANIRNARAVLSTVLLQAGIPISVASEGRVNSALTGLGGAMLEAAEAAIGFYTQFSDPAKTVYTWNRVLPNSRDAFLDGSLVLYPGFASERAFLAGANPNLTFDMAAIPQPGTASGKSTYGLLYFAAIPTSSLNPTGAVEVALALSNESPTLAAMLGMAPAKSGSLTPPANDRYAAVFYPEALRARGWLSPAPAIVDGIFAGMIGNVTSGRQSISDAVQSAAESLDAALP